MRGRERGTRLEVAWQGTDVNPVLWWRGAAPFVMLTA